MNWAGVVLRSRDYLLVLVIKLGSCIERAHSNPKPKNSNFVRSHSSHGSIDADLPWWGPSPQIRELPLVLDSDLTPQIQKKNTTQASEAGLHPKKRAVVRIWRSRLLLSREAETLIVVEVSTHEPESMRQKAVERPETWKSWHTEPQELCQRRLYPEPSYS